MVEQPSVAGTRLSSQAYAEHLAADVHRLAAASADLDAPVPGCPDWLVRDLVRHVIGVYRHKIVALDTGARPPQPEPPAEWGDLAEDADPVLVLLATYAELAERLGARTADSPSWTWWQAEQTVGFWQRRMAQETAVHRWDAESAAHGLEGAGEIDEELAADGIDELLGWLTFPWDDMPQEEARGQRVLVSCGERSWTVTLDQTDVTVVAGGDDGDALVAAAPSGLLLHLWGRPGEHGIATGGDPVALRLFRDRLDVLGS